MGYIIATPGNVIDYDIIEETINTTYHLHKVIRLEYDRYNATQLIQGQRALMFPIFASHRHYFYKEFEKLVYSGKIKHDPAVAWMLASCYLC
jgi:phage terminase large subunit-like protein